MHHLSSFKILLFDDVPYSVKPIHFVYDKFHQESRTDQES